MALDRPVHAPEAADGTTEPAVALQVAQGSAVHGGLAQMPPDFWPSLRHRHAPASGAYSLAGRPVRLRRPHPSEGNSRGQTMPKASPPLGTPFRAVVMWGHVIGDPEYTLRYRKLAGNDSELSWRPVAASSDSAWTPKYPDYDPFDPPDLFEYEITGLEQGAIYAFQLNYTGITGSEVFSAREMYAWPYDDFPNPSLIPS